MITLEESKELVFDLEKLESYPDNKKGVLTKLIDNFLNILDSSFAPSNSIKDYSSIIFNIMVNTLMDEDVLITKEEKRNRKIEKILE